MSDEFEAKAREIVRSAWDRAPHLQLEDVLIASIAQALRDAQPKYPSDEQIELTSVQHSGETYYPDREAGIAQASFTVGARWALENMKGK